MSNVKDVEGSAFSECFLLFFCFLVKRTVVNTDNCEVHETQPGRNYWNWSRTVHVNIRGSKDYIIQGFQRKFQRNPIASQCRVQISTLPGNFIQGFFKFLQYYVV